MKKHAFTLIELLVVIAIIAILAAILFPVFAQAKSAAKSAATISNAKQVLAGIHMYANEYDDLTPIPQYGPDGVSDDSWDSVTWGTLAYPYIKSAGVYDDATQSSPIPHGSIGSGQNWTSYTTLAANFSGFFVWGDLSSGFAWRQRTISAQENLAKRAAVMTNRMPDNHAWGYFLCLSYMAPSPNTDPGASQADYWWDNQVWASTKYHRGNVITGYGDSHAGAINGKRIFCPQNEKNTGCQFNADYWGDWIQSTR